MTPALFNHPVVRPHVIKGDHMEPSLRSGDFLMVRPSKVYDGEGVYLLDFDGEGEGVPFMAERVPVRGVSEVRIWHVNPAYSRHVISVDDFNRAVCGKVVAEVRMKERLPDVRRRMAA